MCPETESNCRHGDFQSAENDGNRRGFANGAVKAGRPLDRHAAPTHRQLQVLGFIYDRFKLQGRPPTLREIGMEHGIRSTNGVYDHLSALERKGFIVRDKMKSRAIRISTAGYDLLGMPVLETRERAAAEEDIARQRALLARCRHVLRELAPRSVLVSDLERELGQ